MVQPCFCQASEKRARGRKPGLRLHVVLEGLQKALAQRSEQESSGSLRRLPVR